MKATERTQIVTALRVAAHALSGGTLAYPPKMADVIYDKVQGYLAASYLHIVRKHIKDLEPKLAIARGDSGVDVPFPRLPSGIVSDINAQVSRMLREWGGNEMESITTALTSMSRLLGDEIKETVRLSAPEVEKVLTKLKKLKSVKDLQKLNRNELHIVVAVCITAYHWYANPVFRKAERILKDYLSSDYDSRHDSGPPSAAEEKLVKSFEAKLASLREREDFYSKLVKKSVAKTRFTWDEQVDLRGLSEKYPIKIHQELTITVVLSMDNRQQKFAGTWTSLGRTLNLYVSKPRTGFEVPTQGRFREMRIDMRDTIEHELMHMVQYLMHETLMNKKAEQSGKPRRHGDGKNAGTPYSPKTLPEEEYGANRAAKQAFPKATDEERYLLDPVEFYPWLRNEASRFVHTYANLEPNQLPGNWPYFVKSRPFFKALKKHNPPMFRKAVSEGWKLVQQLRSSS